MSSRFSRAASAKRATVFEITVQLTSAANGYTIWLESYDRELENIFEMQEEDRKVGSRGPGSEIGGSVQLTLFEVAGTQM